MTLTTPYSATFYVGDGETKTFPYLFEEVSESFISVIVYNSLTGQSSTPTYIVDTDQKQVIFGDDTPAPTADETVCIYRNTPNVQDTPFRTLQGYDAKALENILSKIVAMIQEIKSNYFTTQVLQGDPWQLDLLKTEDDGATVNIDYTAKKLVKGLYFQITNGNLQVSADGSSYITMPKSADIVEFRQVQTVLEDLTVQYRLQYRIGNEWFNAESNAEATADEAKQIAEEARDIASDAKDIAQDASDKVDGFDDRLTQAEQDASDAKDIAQDASDAVSAHVTDTNNPHSVTAAQIGALPDTTKYGATLSLTINSTTYVVTAQLKDQDGNNLGTAQTIDLPLESVVVSGAYDSVTKEVVLTLQGGSTIRFSVADLVSGLQTEITALNMLDADLVDDTTSTHKFVTTTEKSTWNGKQDTISDLSTIRSNAQAGKVASDTIATYGDIVTHDVAEFATAAQGAKADTALQAGDNVSELVNDAGYLVMGDLTNFVTKNTAQTITADKTFTGVTSFQNGSGAGCITIGADAGATTVTADARKIGRMNFRTQDLNTNCVFVSTDSQDGVNYVEIGGRAGDQTNTSPDILRFVITKVHNSKSSSNKLETLTMDKNTSSFFVPARIQHGSYQGGLILGADAGANTLTADARKIARVVACTQDLATNCALINFESNNNINAIDLGGAAGEAVNTVPDVINFTVAGTHNSKTNKNTVLVLDKQKANFLVQPKYNNVNLATINDVPTVNNPTITITQGGVTKGSFTLNQATGDTIALDAGGGNVAWGSIVGTLSDQSDLSAALAGKVDKGFDIVEFQAPTAANNYTWYKKYRNGWVEQGGIGSANTQVTLPIQMQDVNYTVTACALGTTVLAVGINRINTTSMYINTSAQVATWQVSGMAAN